MRTAVLTSLTLAFTGITLAQRYPINITDVPMSLRQTWCLNQRTSCPLLCLQETGGEDGGTRSNTCEAENLVYNCVCMNGISPNLSEYSQTIPFYECQTFGNECVEACGLGNNACADACRSDNPCGAQDPSGPNATAPTPTPSTTASAADNTGEADDTNSQSLDSQAGGNNNNGGGSGAAAIGANYGLTILISGLFAGFTMLL